MYNSFRVFIFCVILSFPIQLLSQGTGNSPFSQFGIGDITGSGNIRNIGMGNAGVSSRHHYFVNILNPALLPNLRNVKKIRPNHKITYYDYYINQFIDSTVKIDFSLTYHYRNLQNSIGDETTKGINMANLTFALPLGKYWASAIGINPYSSANYNLDYSATVIGDPNLSTKSSYTGTGGLFKLFFSNGVSLTKNLAIGLETAYLFGNINNTSSTVIADLNSKSFGFKKQNNYSCLALKPGLIFRKEILKNFRDTIYKKNTEGERVIDTIQRRTKSSGLFYNVGLTYDFYTSLSILQKTNLFVMESNNRIYLDTTIQSSRFKATLPPSLRLGLSIDKPLKWTVAADIHYTDWSVYTPSFMTDTLAASYGVNIGGEYSVNQFKLKAKTYRLGFSYLKSPIYYNGKQPDDISVSFGATVPFGRKSHTNPVLPRVSVAIVLGQRGDVNSFDLKEQYIKGYLSVLINEKWFNKRKIY